MEFTPANRKSSSTLDRKRLMDPLKSLAKHEIILNVRASKRAALYHNEEDGQDSDNPKSHRDNNARH
jgi:hypothetical protein